MHDREADLKYLNNRIRTSPTIAGRNRARAKAKMIWEQLTDPQLVTLRGYLIHAERINNATKSEGARRAIMAYVAGRWS